MNIAKQILLSLIVIAALAVILSFKVGYHVDEMLTFHLANHQGFALKINDGHIYSGAQLWQEYIVVNKANTFDYANVFTNQQHDVHPPLYYILIHTICSFSPDSFSMWMGGGNQHNSSSDCLLADCLAI